MQLIVNLCTSKTLNIFIRGTSTHCIGQMWHALCCLFDQGYIDHVSYRPRIIKVDIEINSCLDWNQCDDSQKGMRSQLRWIASAKPEVWSEALKSLSTLKTWAILKKAILGLHFMYKLTPNIWMTWVTAMQLKTARRLLWGERNHVQPLWLPFPIDSLFILPRFNCMSVFKWKMVKNEHARREA